MLAVAVQLSRAPQRPPAAAARTPVCRLLRVQEQLVPFHALAFQRDCVPDSQPRMPHRQHERFHPIRVPWIPIARVQSGAETIMLPAVPRRAVRVLSRRGRVQCRCDMNRVERAECCRQRLRRAIENLGINLHEFQRRDQLQDRGAPTRCISPDNLARSPRRSNVRRLSVVTKALETPCSIRRHWRQRIRAHLLLLEYPHPDHFVVAVTSDRHDRLSIVDEHAGVS